MTGIEQPGTDQPGVNQQRSTSISSDTSLSIVATPTTAKANRFVMNKVEKAWIITQLIAFGCPLQKMKTLDTTCARVAANAQSRHIPYPAIVEEQNQYGLCWRRAYMARITADNVRNILNAINDMAKKVAVASMIEEDGEDDGPTAAARGKERDAQHILDQVVLDYRHKASKRTLTTDDGASKAINRAYESRAQKKKSNDERKKVFKANKKRQSRAREARDRRSIAADVQQLREQTRIANAASASASLQRRQSEQFGILTDLFARSHNLVAQQPVTPLPPELPQAPLIMDPVLLSVEEEEVDSSVSGVAPDSTGHGESVNDNSVIEK